MKRLFAGGTCLAAVLAFGMVALAQEPTPSQPPSQPQTAPPTTPQQPTTPPPTQPEPSTRPSTRQQSEMRSSSEQQVTIVGCVVSESDYRRSKNLGGAGAMGTGVGAGNEFVLVNASMSHGASAAGAAAGEPSATGTAGSAASGTEAYELTGSGESKAGSFVGKRVEVIGKLKASETGATGTTGGATAGKPPSGVDVNSQDLRLKEIDVTSVRETTGTCPSTGSAK